MFRLDGRCLRYNTPPVKLYLARAVGLEPTTSGVKDQCVYHSATPLIVLTTFRPLVVNANVGDQPHKYKLDIVVMPGSVEQGDSIPYCLAGTLRFERSWK